MENTGIARIREPGYGLQDPMSHRGFLGLLFLVAIGWLFPMQARAADEKSRIEGLISHIENLKDAKFIRNGKSYDSKNAAKFLRGKWEAHAKEIKTAEDFIDKAGSVSGTTGKPYIIKFNDGREVKCGEYLKEQLKKA
jgi:hypothetical protein